jgi:polysaccharide export outer membrane protein
MSASRMNSMIRLRILASLLVGGWVSVLAGCTDRAPLAEPATVGSGPYLLGTGDRLRIVVYDQPSLTNLYEVDASGQISMPLVGDIAASEATVDELAHRIEAKLASGYLRDPNVTVEVAIYRPFFVLGEVGNPGQFTYVPGLTAEMAVAVAGGYTDRANKRVVRISRTINGKLYESRIPVIELIRPGDTVYVPESLF